MSMGNARVPLGVVPARRPLHQAGGHVVVAGEGEPVENLVERHNQPPPDTNHHTKHMQIVVGG